MKIVQSQRNSSIPAPKPFIGGPGGRSLPGGGSGGRSPPARIHEEHHNPPSTNFFSIFFIYLNIIFQYIFNIFSKFCTSVIFCYFYLILDSLQASSCLGGNREAKSISFRCLCRFVLLIPSPFITAGVLFLRA